MRANALPWILVAVLAGAWLGATFFGAEPECGSTWTPPVEDEGALRAELASVRAEVARLTRVVDDLERARPATLEGRQSAPVPVGGPRTAAPIETGETTAAPEVTGAPQIVRAERNRQASARSQLWLDQLRSLDSAAVREEALRSIRGGLDAADPVEVLASLRAVRWLGSNDYDHAEYRAAILTYARSEDPDVRRAAREALAVVQPMTSDLDWWLEEARTADRSNAESTAGFLVRVAEGRVEGKVADAVLHLLREGTDIRKAFVMRGLQQATVFDPAVEARLVEIVRSVDPQDYDSHYFFHFLAPRLDPKSDAVVELILDRVGQGKGDLATPLRGLRKGLSERQRAHAAQRLLGFAENAGTTYTRRAVLEGFRHVGGPEDVARLQALADDPDADDATRAAAQRAIRAVEHRGR